jgi:hypothetical protein
VLLVAWPAKPRACIGLRLEPRRGRPGAGVRILANAAGPVARAGYRASDGRSLRSELRLLSEFQAEYAAESAGLGAARIWSRGFGEQ